MRPLQLASALLLAACTATAPAPVEPGRADAGDADAAPPPPGWQARYYRGYQELALERVDDTIDFAWALEAPSPEVGADYFSVRWEGRLRIDEAGTYEFATAADDGVRLWVDGAVVIDDWRLHGLEEHRGAVELEAGEVPVRFEYFEAHSPAEVHLRWRPPGAAADAIVPAERMRAVAVTDAAASPPAGVYQNPVFATDCPDPGVIAADGAFFASCTGGRFRILSSPDLVRWEDTGASILPDGRAPWSANGGRNWAPELHAIGDRMVAYYTAVNGADVLSIGAASADGPLGPYVDRGGPLVEHPSGVIDAHLARDTDGRLFLFYKIDGNAQGQPTPIYARELAADGLSFAPGSSEVEVLRNDPSTWEGGVVEAHWVVHRDGFYYLFYSGNVYDHRYRTGVARATSILGPYEKLGPPILGNNERWVGPGHGSVLRVGEVDYFVYHAWNAAPGGVHDGPGGRKILLDRIDWVDGWPRIHDGTPSRSQQAWPAAPSP